jgi:hypothetical protein
MGSQLEEGENIQKTSNQCEYISFIWHTNLPVFGNTNDFKILFLSALAFNCLNEHT